MRQQQHAYFISTSELKDYLDNIQRKVFKMRICPDHVISKAKYFKDFKSSSRNTVVLYIKRCMVYMISDPLAYLHQIFQLSKK